MNLINNPIHFLNSKKEFKSINKTINDIYNISNLKQNILDCFKQNVSYYELYNKCKFCFNGLEIEFFEILRREFNGIKIESYYENFKLTGYINYVFQTILELKK